MELRDYGTALRRYWTTWVGLALAGVLVALTVVLVSTPTYQATAQVFVASTGGEGTSGAQFVNQRVTTYPDVARSRTVLGSVIEELGIQESFADLRARVAAVNPTRHLADRHQRLRRGPGGGRRDRRCRRPGVRARGGAARTHPRR
jgi:capsular polysaccharide biosynthesis protein